MSRNALPTKATPRHRGLTVAVGLAVAATASMAGIVWAVGSDRQAAGVATSPFGWTRLVVIHSLSALMLAWSLAWIVARWRPGVATRRCASLWAVVGLVAVVLSGVAGDWMAHRLDLFRSGYVTRLSLRILWCTAMELPWCLATLAVITPPREETRSKQRDRRPRRGGDDRARWSFLDGANAPNMFSTPSGFALAVITAVGVPLSFLAVFLEQQTELARVAWQRGELVATRRIVQRLADVGSTASLGQRAAPPGSIEREWTVTPRLALAELDEAIAFVGQRLEPVSLSARNLPRDGRAPIGGPEGPSAGNDFASDTRLPTKQRIEWAKHCLSLDQTPQAKAVLEPIADRDPAAALLLARIEKRSGTIDRCRERAEQALKLARRSELNGAEDAASLGMIQLHAYEILAVCAGEEADFERAEQLLLEAEEHLPRHRAAIHHRLGKHYEFIGDLRLAMAHERKAAELDPETYPPPESLLRRILSTGAPVGLARPKSSRYQ